MPVLPLNKPSWDLVLKLYPQIYRPKSESNMIKSSIKWNPFLLRFLRPNQNLIPSVQRLWYQNMQSSRMYRRYSIFLQHNVLFVEFVWTSQSHAKIKARQSKPSTNACHIRITAWLPPVRRLLKAHKNWKKVFHGNTSKYGWVNKKAQKIR